MILLPWYYSRIFPACKEQIFANSGGRRTFPSPGGLVLPQGRVAEAAAVHAADLFDQGGQIVLGLGDAAGVGTGR